jgi:hypothetical protein
MSLRGIFVNNQSVLRPVWRFVLFLALYVLGDGVLDRALTRIHFPDAPCIEVPLWVKCCA